jgi:hypothetical protein
VLDHVENNFTLEGISVWAFATAEEAMTATDAPGGSSMRNSSAPGANRWLRRGTAEAIRGGECGLLVHLLAPS